MSATNTLRLRLLQLIREGDEQNEARQLEPPLVVVQERRDGWWEHLLANFFNDNEDLLFSDLRLDRRVFATIVNAVGDISLTHRGRRGFVHSHRERVVFLHVYLSFGIDTLMLLLSPRIKTPCEIHRVAKATCEMYLPRLKDLFVVKRDEWRTDPNNVGFVIDCTVVQVRRPGVDFNEAKLWFSGKHHIYCAKKEVVVNARTGTAAFVSRGRPGSVHDITLMRADSEAINGMIGHSTLLGDKGYGGGESCVPFLLVVEDDTRRDLRVQRAVVECYFGRLKNKYKIFGRKWGLGVDCFDDFFDCACAYTNVDVLVNPLTVGDKQHHEDILNLWQRLETERQRRRQARNDAYRIRRTEQRQAVAELFRMGLMYGPTVLDDLANDSE